MRLGTRVWFEGPYGIFTDAGRTAPRLAVVAAGIGITPVRALLEDSRLQAGEATVVLRASSPSDTYLWGEVQDLARSRSIRVTTMIGRRSSDGPAWMTQQASDGGTTLSTLFPDLLRSDLYICGPTAWLDAVESDARRAGVPDFQIHAERFDW